MPQANGPCGCSPSKLGQELIDHNLIPHPEHRMHEMAAVRWIDPGAGDEGDALGLVALELDLAARCGAGADRRGREEGARSEIVAAARAVDEHQGHRPSGREMD